MKTSVQEGLVKIRRSQGREPAITSGACLAAMLYLGWLVIWAYRIAPASHDRDEDKTCCDSLRHGFHLTF